ncbi:unnamed protein product, partial [Sphagnum jensenii]
GEGEQSGERLFRVVVLGLFNAAIGIADIYEDLYYDDSVCTYLHPPSGAGEV